MLCEECKKRPAVVHFTKIVNDQRNERHLCEECARDNEGFSLMGEPSLDFQKLLSGFFDVEPRATFHSIQCGNCGLSHRDFHKLGHLGCPECYEHLKPHLQPLLRRIHGSASHRGKVPGGFGANMERRIQDLRGQLQEAIGREEYEQAAKIRDQIWELEKQDGRR